MTFDLQRILESKRTFRQRLAAQPIAEKLRILDALRARALSLRGVAGRPLATNCTRGKAPSLPTEPWHAQSRPTAPRG